MPLRITVIADPLTCLAFGLAGIETRPVHGAAEAAAALAAVQQGGGTGLVLITERVADTIREQVDRLVLETTIPLLLEIPDRDGPVPGRKSTRERMVTLMGS
ncbi:MAG TPA: Vacuolar H+transporting two-sector ATPase F subunit [Desulfobulbus sp.]|nr:Vacuolar H+transporting two-sector ATPase F subunit [Desulfobulbus sp.]